jgi:hypothetical protein
MYAANMAEPDYSKCLAREVSPCEGGMSKEHVFSRTMFLTETITISGHPSGLQKLPIDQLVVKRLCRKHNAQLSDVDTAFGDFVNVLRETEHLIRVRSLHPETHWAEKMFVVDGNRIERCIFKTIINCALALNKNLNGWAPALQLANVVFGINRPLPGCGVGLLARIGDEIGAQESIGVSFGISQTREELQCALLNLRNGWKFICSWNEPLRELGLLDIEGVPHFADEDLLCPVKRVNFEGSKAVGLSISFDSSGTWKKREHPDIVRLRTKYPAPPRNK